MRIARALGVMALAGAACASPTEPLFTLTVRYVQQVPPGFPDPAATGCLHHFAPINLTVSTRSGASARMTPAPGGGGLFATVEAPAGDQWLSIVDINFCGHPPPGTPSPVSGVSVNGVTLTRTSLEGDRRLFLFSVTERGDIQP